MKPEATPLREEPHKRAVGLPDFLSQFFDITTRQFRVDASLAGILEFSFDSLKVDHGAPFSQFQAFVPVDRSRTGCIKTNMSRFVLQLFLFRSSV
ncbi:MAG TPA: hypothetical protein VKP67_07645 [Xanthobacteraceae bacterium]|nr:hypothetical protein [Xanthobacteraceae bacterium]